MTNKTIGEIREDHGRRATGIINGYRDALDALRKKREPEGVEYLGALNDAEKYRVLERERKDGAEAAYSQARKAYESEVQRHHAEVRARRPAVEERLFAMPGADSVAMLSQAALASEEELANLLDLGVAARNEALIRTTLIAAERRGFAETVVRALDAAPDEVREATASGRRCPTSRSWIANSTV